LLTARSANPTLSTLNYPATFFACFLTLAHRFFAAFTIAALPAAAKTRFFTPTSSRSAVLPTAFAAAWTPFNWCCNFPSCFLSFFSSLNRCKNVHESSGWKSISTRDISPNVPQEASSSFVIASVGSKAQCSFGFPLGYCLRVYRRESWPKQSMMKDGLPSSICCRTKQNMLGDN